MERFRQILIEQDNGNLQNKVNEFFSEYVESLFMLKEMEPGDKEYKLTQENARVNSKKINLVLKKLGYQTIKFPLG